MHIIVGMLVVACAMLFVLAALPLMMTSFVYALSGLGITATLMVVGISLVIQ